MKYIHTLLLNTIKSTAVNMLRRHVIVVALTVFLLTPTLTHSLNQEGQYLLKAKLSFDDPKAVLADWDPRDDTPCNWNGVVCDPSTESVISLDLSSSGLSGPFPAALCGNLKRVTFVSFNDNFINSTLTENDVVSCQSLRHLDLAQNYLTGALPGNLPELPNLSYLDLAGNNFSGSIPDAYGRFRKLEVLALTGNLLGGTIPSFLGNISTLKQLNLSYNPFNPGRIPDDLGNLTNLEVLWLTETGLVGEIPASLGRLRRLVDLDLAYNYLTGSIPGELTGLTNVVQIELYNNSLTGELPATGWSNVTNLRRLDASTNRLTGPIPAELCELPLESLNLYENDLIGELPPEIADSPNLYELRLFQNRLNGNLPINLGKNSPLMWLDLSTNDFSGGIPENLCERGVLEDLLLLDNSFSGEIPAGLGDCRSLLRVRLGQNRFSGEVPEGFWGLPHVSLMELADNRFAGSIAKNIATASNLSQLILSGNNFSGNLSDEIGLLPSLIELSLSDNNFSGPLPETTTNLQQLTNLDLRRNSFSGELPAGISNWKKLNDLNLANNAFSGSIPDEIGDLTGLNYLDLSGNHFSGRIPPELQNLKLNLLNLSNNELSGEIPPIFAKKIYGDSFLGNPGLCDNGKRSHRHIWILRSLLTITALLLSVALFFCFYSKYKNTKTRTEKSIEGSKWTLTSFHKLSFDVDDILHSLEEDNIVGSGSSGKVYKVALNETEAVAVKKLWGPPSKIDVEKQKPCLHDDGFEAEVETLGRIRHKNVVKLWCCCTAREGKLLVYEYMVNGSLGDVLHGSKGDSLDWPIRFKIALDAAEGLSYLHHDCVPPIVHRDVKSNNILLDVDYGARISDFGLAKVVGGGGKAGAQPMSVVVGSFGYIAPEYSYTLRVNERSDVYSYGVVVLELVTGKRPIDPEYGVGKDLVKWVRGALDQKGVDLVIDPRLDSCFKDEICRVLNVGLLCTSPLPINRPSMRRVVKMLQEIGEGFGNNYNPLKAYNGSKDGKLTPYYYEDASDNGSVV